MGDNIQEAMADLGKSVPIVPFGAQFLPEFCVLFLLAGQSMPMGGNRIAYEVGVCVNHAHLPLSLKGILNRLYDLTAGSNG